MSSTPERFHIGSHPLPGLAEEVDHEDGPGRTFRELSESGLLWLINSAVFHPRGFALALSMDTITGKVTGWDIIGDGKTPFRYADDMDVRFMAAENTLAGYRLRADRVQDGTELVDAAAAAREIARRRRYLLEPEASQTTGQVLQRICDLLLAAGGGDA